MKEIKLINGGYAKVDDDDFNYLNQFQWYSKETAFYYYAKAHINGKAIYMHKLLIPQEYKERMLHINGDGLDNRKSNLIPCSNKDFCKTNPRRKKYIEEQGIEVKKIRNREQIIKWRDSGRRSLYFKHRRLNDLNYKIKSKLYVKLWMILKTGPCKNKVAPRYEKLIGCNKEYLKLHIELQFKEGMTWDNHGINGWQIDHIVPVSAFDLTDTTQQEKCFHYSNLRPLWAEENKKKGKKIL